MSSQFLRKSALILVSGMLVFFTGCGLDKAYFQDLYSRSCSESTSVPFEKLGAASTCNGVPILVALTLANDYKVNDQAEDLVSYLVDNGVNMDARENATGRNSLMIAIDTNQARLATALAPHTPHASLDNSQRNYIHHLIPTKWASYSKLLQYSQQEYAVPLPSGISSIQAAYKARNYPLIWNLAELGASIDFLKSTADQIPTEFFFNKDLESQPRLLDNFPNAVNARSNYNSSDPTELSVIQNYTLLHFAIRYDLHNLFNYLISRGVDLDVVSSVGSPLGLAIQWNRTDMVNTLLGFPNAIRASGVIEAALQSANSDWMNVIIASTQTIQNYSTTLFSNCSNNACLEITGFDINLLGPDNPPYDAIDGSGNNRLAQLLYAFYRAPIANKIGYDRVESALHDHLAKIESDYRGSNKLKQNVAHFMMALVPVKDNGKFRSWYLDNMFSDFIAKATELGLIDQIDGLGMTPLHHFLTNPDRKTCKDEDFETSVLQQLLQATKHYQNLTHNRDSILGLAVMTGKASLVQAILDFDPNMKKYASLPNAQNMTPLQIAQKIHSGDIYEILR